MSRKCDVFSSSSWPRRVSRLAAAGDAETGLKITHSVVEFDVVVTDFKLPGMSGLDFMLRVNA